MEQVMRRFFCLLLSALFLAVLLSGCQKENANPIEEETPNISSETVNLTVWGAEEDEELLRQIFDSFQKEYLGQADFLITYVPQTESSCTNMLMGDLEQGADVFAFADDQLNTLVASGALDPVENPQIIKETNLEEAVHAASVNDTLYAFPLTADNGYFLYIINSIFPKKIFYL